MNKGLKGIILSALPITIFISCIFIGIINSKTIAVREGDHRTMSSAISFIGWSLRGIYAASLTAIFFRFAKQSNISKIRKRNLALMIVILNLPIIFLMDLAVFFPLLALVIIFITNLITFLAVTKFKPNE